MNTVFNQLRQATISARQRTGDQAISTNVKQGLIQVCRVIYAKGGNSIVTPLTGYVPAADAVSFLESRK